MLFSHVICRNPDIHDEYEKCGIIKTINLIKFNVLKELVLLSALITSFKIYKPVFINIPVKNNHRIINNRNGYNC